MKYRHFVPATCVTHWIFNFRIRILKYHTYYYIYVYGLFRFLFPYKFLFFFNQLHAVSRIQQGRQRKPETKTKVLRHSVPHFPLNFSRHCAWSGETQRRALPLCQRKSILLSRYRNHDRRVTVTLSWLCLFSFIIEIYDDHFLTIYRLILFLYVKGN